MTSSAIPSLEPAARDRLYSHCSRAITQAGHAAESLLLARLVLLLMEQVGDEVRCSRAIDEALRELPAPSLSAG
jgi:hypothetical protein